MTDDWTRWKHSRKAERRGISRVNAFWQLVRLRIIARDEAEADIAEAALWYERRCAGLGREFVQAVDARFELIAHQADIFRSFIEMRVWGCSGSFRIS